MVALAAATQRMRDGGTIAETLRQTASDGTPFAEVLARQLGGSFGIAILATYVTVHTQIHRVDLLANVYPGNPLVDQRLKMLAANLVTHGYGPDAAQRGALAILDQETMRQASMLSYNDAWMLLLLTFICVAPAILLLRKPRGRSVPPAEVH